VAINALRRLPLESVGEYQIGWYEEVYWTRGSYSPYQDFARHNDVFRKILGYQPASMLDVGCAYGFMVGRCWGKGIPAVGLDVSEWCGKNFAAPGYYVRGSGWALPFKNKSFDLLYCEGVLEHIPEDKIPLVFQEFIRVANRGMLGISYDCPTTDHHICNHDFGWWAERIPPGFFLGTSGQSLDREESWYVKSS